MNEKNQAAKTTKLTVYAASDDGDISQPNPAKPFGICTVIEGEAGYHPVMGYSFATFELAEACAQRFNDRLGISAETALRIVGASIAKQNEADRDAAAASRKRNRKPN